jgi:hypothetical protein
MERETKESKNPSAFSGKLLKLMINGMSFWKKEQGPK